MTPQAFLTILISCVLTGIILMVLIRDMKNTAKFVTYHIPFGDEPVKLHPRGKMIAFAAKTWAVIFVAAIISTISSIIFFVMLFLWVFLLYLMFNFAKSWKAHGYPMVLLLLPTFVILAVGVVAAPPIKLLVRHIADWIRY